MAAGFITLPQAIMSVVGGVPVMPAGGQTIIENLRAAKSMIPGNMSGLMGQIMQNGPGALLQNPISGVLGQVQGQLGGIVGQIQQIASGDLGIGNFGGMLTALTGTGGLTQALGQLSSVSSALSGLTQPGAGGFGLMDAIGHANIVQMLGEHMPPGLGIAQAMGPVLMGGQLSSMTGQLASMAAAIGSGTIDPFSAATRIAGMTQTINGVLNDHTHAISSVQNQILGISSAAGAISLIASGPPEFAPIANMLIQDQHKATIQSAMDDQVAHADLSGDDSDWS